MNTIKINNVSIKIIGLLGDFPAKKRIEFQNKLLNSGYREDYGTHEQEKLLKDIFYSDFRNIMFIKEEKENDKELLSRRFFSEEEKELKLLTRDKTTNQIIKELPVAVSKSEIFLFGQEIGMFALTLKISPDNLTINFISDLIYQCRKFDYETDMILPDGKFLKWHEWISKNYLCDTILRHERKKIKVDDYSGSKFKIFSVIDTDVPDVDRLPLLFDIGTSSPLGSAKGNGGFAPHDDYYNEVIANKISVFKNWESICLFDSFTTIGNGILIYPGQKPTWEQTYFRIYLFRLFFKYNLYRYNSDLRDNTVKLRDQFETFLNNYNISNISFNFLPNVIFNKIGDALNLEFELKTFQERINKISAAILEEKQSRMNLLLQIVTILGSISSIEPVLGFFAMAKSWLGIDSVLFDRVLIIFLLVMGYFILIFLFPDQAKKVKKNIVDFFKKSKKTED